MAEQEFYALLRQDDWRKQVVLDEELLDFSHLSSYVNLFKQWRELRKLDSYFQDYPMLIDMREAEYFDMVDRRDNIRLVLIVKALLTVVFIQLIFFAPEYVSGFVYPLVTEVLMYIEELNNVSFSGSEETLLSLLDSGVMTLGTLHLLSSNSDLLTKLLKRFQSGDCN